MAEFEKNECKINLQEYCRKSAANVEVRGSSEERFISRQLVADLSNDLTEDQNVL